MHFACVLDLKRSFFQTAYDSAAAADSRKSTLRVHSVDSCSTHVEARRPDQASKAAKVLHSPPFGSGFVWCLTGPAKFKAVQPEGRATWPKKNHLAEPDLFAEGHGFDCAGKAEESAQESTNPELETIR